MMSSKEVKNYFKSRETVSGWWNPEEGDHAIIYDRQSRIVQHWLSHVQTALEVSCGKGRTAARMVNAVQRYVCVDISLEMLRLAINRTHLAKMILGDAEALPIQSNSQDAVICLEALVHYPNSHRAIEEFYRILRPGGVLIIDSDNRKSLRRLVKRIYALTTNSTEFGSEIFTPYSREEFKSLLSGAGFRVERLEYLGVGSPIRIRKNEGTKYFLSPHYSRKLDKLRLDDIPLIQRLATYHLVLARK